MGRAVRWAGATQGVQARTAPQGTERSAGDPGCGRQHSEHSKGRSQRYRLHTDGEQLGAGRGLAGVRPQGRKDVPWAGGIWLPQGTVACEMAWGLAELCQRFLREN